MKDFKTILYYALGIIALVFVLIVLTSILLKLKKDVFIILMGLSIEAILIFTRERR